MLISEISVYEFLKEKIKLAEDELKKGDYATKKDIKDLEIKIEKGFKEIIIWVIGAMVAIGGLSIAIIKLL